MKWHAQSPKEVAEILKTDFNFGLDENLIKQKEKIYGKNKLPQEKPLSSFKIFLHQLKNPLIYILVAAGSITIFFKHFADAIVIYGAVLLNTTVGFIQEKKASKSLSALKTSVKQEAKVMRGGRLKIIDSECLVPGDIIFLEAGQKVPADGRIISAQELSVNEMFLTGEWLPANKNHEDLPPDTPLADRDNMVYMGSIVEKGFGKAVVTGTGIKTEIGKIAQLIRESKNEKTPYQKRVIRLSKIIGILIVCASFVVFVLGTISRRSPLEMFLTSVAMAVAAIPEGMPIAITVILASGMQRILQKKGLVRKMVSAETLGSTSIICTDKTGTLTEGRMKVAGVYDPPAIFNNKELKTLRDGGKNTILKIAFLRSDAFIENPNDSSDKWLVRGRPTDRALLLAGIESGLNKEKLNQEYPEIEVMPFDSSRKYSASLHKTSEQEIILYVLGAPEKILEMSQILTENQREKIKQKVQELAQRGERVLAGAYRKIEKQKEKKINELCEKMIFAGLISLHDPLRKEVKEAISICRKAGMIPIIVTGDHKLTARSVANDLGLNVDDENIIEGKDLEKMSDYQLQEKIEKIKIYARVEPQHKMRIIEAWQRKGKIVAMTGDGINDAPALKKADIGVALGSGTDVAKEASDLILLNDSFSIIVVAVEEGRGIVENIRKTVTLLLSQCFSEIILIGACIISGLPLPILPTQILWENLIEGSPQGVALGFEKGDKNLMNFPPENPKNSLLTKEMKTIILVFGIVASITLFGMFLWLYKSWGISRLSEIRTIIFAALAVDTFFYAFSCRNLRKNLWQYNPLSNLYLTGFIIFSFIMLLLAVYFAPLQEILQTNPLTFFHWFLILVLGTINLVLIEGMKYYFILKAKSSVAKNEQN